MKINISSAQEYENSGIGLLAGAYYVVGTLDDDLFREVEQQDFTRLEWQRECMLLTIHGANGKLLIRFGWLDRTGYFIRFKVPANPPRHASLRLLHAQAHDPRPFLAGHLDAPVRRVGKTKKGFDRLGLLIGDEQKRYSSLLSWEDGYLTATDVEPRPGGGAARELTVMLPLTAAEEAGVRTTFRQLAASGRPDPYDRFNTNTRLALQPVPGGA